MQCLFGIAKRYSDYRKLNTRPLWSQGKQNDIATNLERLTSVLPGHMLLPDTPQQTWAWVTRCPRSDCTNRAASLPQVRHLLFCYQQKIAGCFMFIDIRNTSVMVQLYVGHTVGHNGALQSIPLWILGQDLSSSLMEHDFSSLERNNMNTNKIKHELETNLVLPYLFK